MAVRNPCGLKKPVIQKVFGRPSKHQEWNWVLRSISSVNQNPSVLDSQEIWKKGRRNLTSCAWKYLHSRMSAVLLSKEEHFMKKCTVCKKFNQGVLYAASFWLHYWFRYNFSKTDRTNLTSHMRRWSSLKTPLQLCWNTLHSIELCNIT